MIDNNFVEKLAVGCKELTDRFAADGKLDRMPDVMRYKVLRGYQTHDLHHVVAGTKRHRSANWRCRRSSWRNRTTPIRR